MLRTISETASQIARDPSTGSFADSSSSSEDTVCECNEGEIEASGLVKAKGFKKTSQQNCRYMDPNHFKKIIIR